jgi:hypothetical protein
MKYIILSVGSILVVGVVWWLYTVDELRPIREEAVMCTMDAFQCPDGSYVGRTGPDCEFVCPLAPEIPPEQAAHIESKAELIQLATPLPLAQISSPLIVSGSARGFWFFEGSFPITLTDWDGLIIAEGFATAEGEWMTEEFVPFTAALEFVSPYQSGDPEFMQRGALILQRDNPSDLPQNDDALEITVFFTPSTSTQAIREGV